MTHERALSDRSAMRTLVTAMAAAAAIALVAASPAPAAEKKPAGPPPMHVAVDAVVQQQVKQTIPVIGRLVGRATGLAARIEGSIAELRVDVGDRVAKGDVIAHLVDDQFKWEHELKKAEVRQFEAIVKTQKAKVVLRRQELSRLQRLKESAAFSQARLDDKRQEVVVAESEAAEAEARLAMARAELGKARTVLDDTFVHAPFDGVVAKRLFDIGGFVKIGEPLVLLVSDKGFEIEAEVPAQYTTGLGSSVAVEVSLASGGPTITARVRSVVPSEDPQNRTRTVRLVPDVAYEPEKRPVALQNLADNQSVTLYVPAAAQAEAVTVHKDAVLARDGGRIVYVVKETEAVARSIVLGEAVGNRFIVKSGLKPGELVVVRGNERLRPGQKVTHDGAKPKDGAKKDAERAAAAGKQG